MKSMSYELKKLGIDFKKHQSPHYIRKTFYFYINKERIRLTYLPDKAGGVWELIYGSIDNLYFRNVKQVITWLRRERRESKFKNFISWISGK